jgi:type IV pilus assembly protein PilW
MRPSIQSKFMAGFSLVELMVGVVIGLIGIIVIYQVFAVSEGVKRTTTGGGDAQQNGALALFSIERDARMAGYGMNILEFLGCKTRFYDEGVSPPKEVLDWKLAPLEIVQPANQVPPGVANGPDQISLMYGTSDLTMGPAKLTQDMPSPAAVYKVNNRYGFMPGDAIIAVEPGKDCTIAQVTETPGTPGQSDNVIHNSGNYKDDAGVTHPARYNKAGGLGIAYTTNGYLYNLGSLPFKITYRVEGNRLTWQNEMTDAVSTPILDNVVQVQAQYGKDNNNDQTVDVWDDITPPAGSTDWRKIIAIRVALVARSTTPERPDPATGVCNITTVNPAWMGGEVDLRVTTPDDSWQCYRYKVFQTVVPLRNLIWRPQL